MIPRTSADTSFSASYETTDFPAPALLFLFFDYRSGIGDSLEVI